MGRQQENSQKNNLRVLIVEDCEEDALLMVRELQRFGKNVFFRRVENAAEMMSALAETPWDVILADYNLPGYGALPALAALKAVELDIPFLIVTGAITDELAVAAMKAGACDYIMKDRLSRVGPAVEREIREAAIRAEGRRERERSIELEARYRAVFETSGASLAMVGEGGLLVLVNQQFASLVGYEREMIQGRMKWEDFVGEVDNQEITTENGGLTPRRMYVSEVLDREGSVHNVIISIAPLAAGQGMVASLLDVTADVKAQQMENALRKSENIFRTFLDNIGVGIVVFGPDRRVISANHQYEEWYPQVDFSRRPRCSDWCSEDIDGSACVTCPLVRSLTSGGAYSALQRTDTEKQRHYRVKTAAVKNEAGEVTSVIEMQEDVTEQLLVQEELYKLSAAVEQSPSQVIITDLQGRIEYVNSKFIENSGYQWEEAVGQSTDMLKSGTMPDEHYQNLWRVLRNGGEFQGEFHNRRSDGSVYWVLATISPVRGPDNKITHYLGIEQDITERKAMEDQLRQNNEQLSEALQQLKLIQSRMVQQEKLAGIGQLAAGVAHEINNPLGYVSSNFSTLRKYLERLREVVDMYREFANNSPALCPFPEKLVATLDILHQFEKEKKVTALLADIPDLLEESADGLDRVGAIVKGLRMFSRVDTAGKFSLYDLNGGLESTLLVARNELKYCADVVTELGEVPAMEAVGSEINQVLLNILVNAAHAIQAKSAEKKGKITITTRADAESAYCSISDTGIGISPEKQARIFEPFFTTKAVGRGTGLGLSISYDIVVHKHGGDITVDSRQGEGTIFTLRLPLRQSTGRNVAESAR
ncbi:MAG TPA: PAS domain S-box protein [Patescibacteria group bacterium]|nr:PAS domain S-box protein [Patescibacteria group bacterium]